MMMHGRNNGKKLMTVTIVKHAFEIIHLLTGEVSTQQLSDDVQNCNGALCSKTRTHFYLNCNQQGAFLSLDEQVLSVNLPQHSTANKGA